MAKTNTKWFKKVRGSFIPISWQGWVSYLPYIAYLAISYFYVMAKVGYNFLSLLIIIPNWVAAAVIMSWFAGKRS